VGRYLNWKFWAGLLISALFLYLAFRNLDLHKMWDTVRSADPFYVALAVAVTFFQYVFRTLRWGILLEPLKETGFLHRWNALLVGFAGNCVLPARLGEFVRANYLGQAEEVSSSSTFGTVVVERLFDAFCLLQVLLVGLLYTTFPTEWSSYAKTLRVTGILLFAGGILFIVFLVGFKLKARAFLRLLDRILFFVPQGLRSRLIDMIWNFSLGLVMLKGPDRWAMAILHSYSVWILGLAQIAFISWSIGIDIPLLATCLIMSMAAFGVAIPSAPGFIGTFHLSVQYGFLFYGMGREEGLSAAVLLHAAFYVPTVVLGLVAFLIYPSRGVATKET
jgi:uncharacterized protein (TIRG00374 family)